MSSSVGLSWVPILFMSLLWVTILATIRVSGKYKVQRNEDDTHADSSKRQYRVPILCSAGDSPPASFIYAAGGSMSAMVLVFTVLLESFRIYTVSGNALPALNIAGVVVGLVCSLFLSAMCVISVKYSAIVHNNCAIGFIACGMIYQLLNLALITAADIGNDYHNTIWRAACFGVNLLCCIGIVACMKIVEKILSIELQRKVGQDINRINADKARVADLVRSHSAPPRPADNNPPAIEEKKDVIMPDVLDEFEFSISISWGEKHKKTGKNKKMADKEADKQKSIQKEKPTRTLHDWQNIVVQIWALLQYFSLMVTTLFFVSYIQPFEDQLQISSI